MRLWLLPLLAATAALAGAGSVAHATTRDDRQDKAAADVVNLRSAIVQETYAIHAVEQGSFDDALTALAHSKAALAAVDEGAASILYSDPTWMGHDSGWSNLKTDAQRAASYYDPYAMLYIRDHRGDAEIVSWINSALKFKNKALQAANALAKPPCAQLLNLQGPFVVNGVAQGEPQLTISLRCSEGIKMVKIGTPGETLDSCTDAGQACTIANGSDVTAGAGGGKDMSVTIKGPALADGEKAIVEIVGDSSSYISDDVM